MNLSHIILLLQELLKTETMEIIKLLIVATVPSLVTFFATRQVTKTNLKKSDQEISLADDKNHQYLRELAQKGFDEAIKLEEENLHLRTFQRHSLRLVDKIKNRLDFTGNENLLEELNDLEKEAQENKINGK